MHLNACVRFPRCQPETECTADSSPNKTGALRSTHNPPSPVPDQLDSIRTKRVDNDADHGITTTCTVVGPRTTFVHESLVYN